MKPPRSHAPAASPAYLDARGTPRAEDLAAHDCIVFDSIHAPTSWSFHRDTTDLTIAVRPRIIVCNIEDALKAALAGIGLTRPQSYQVTNSVAAGALRTVLGTDRATRCGQDAVITRAFGGQPRVPPRVASLNRKLEGIDRVCGLRTCLPQCPSTAHTTGAVVHSPTYSSRSTTPANLRADAV